MALILLGEAEIAVSEDVEDILTRIVNARDGLRLGSGTIVAPPGWVILSDADSDAPVYVQVARIGCVREG